MSQNLELPDPIYTALQKAAADQGMTPAAWIASHLAPKANDEETNGTTRRGTLAQRFAGRTGRIASGGKECLSEDTGEKFVDYLEAKRRAGHL